MGTRKWKYVENTFDYSTRDSNVKMLNIGADTKAKLEAEIADPDINTFYVGYEPVYETYRLISDNHDIISGIRQGETLNVETILKINLPIELRKWEGKVRSIYIEDSVDEHRLFPDKRNKFVNGTYQKRIEAIAGLAGRLALDPDVTLQAYAATVQSFHNLALTARNTQQMKEGSLNQVSDTREAQRILLAQELYAVLGGLMRKYKADPSQVERFFDLSLLRETGDGEEESEGTVFEGTVNFGTPVFIDTAPDTLNETSELTLQNPGSVSLNYYVAVNEGDFAGPGVTQINVAPGGEVVISGTDLGVLPTLNKLHVTSAGPTSGNYKAIIAF